MADNGAPHVTRATFYRNGDPNFKGKMMVVNPRYYRNFESFLDTVTSSTRSTNAVTRICTPHGRNFVNNVENFQNGGNYVVLGRERFKKLNYGEAKNKTVTRLPPILRNQMPSSGRYRKVYEIDKQAIRRIHVYKNGDILNPPRTFILKRRDLTDIEHVLQFLQESRMNFDCVISRLFTLKGKPLYSCDEIVHDGRYVVTERGKPGFKPVNYEGISNFSPRTVVNVTRTKLPPIKSRIDPAKITYSPRKPPPQVPNKLGPPKQTKTEKKRVEKRDQKRTQPMPAQDSVVSPFEDQNLTRESFSHVSLSVTPPPLDESPDFTLSEKIGKDNEPSQGAVKRGDSPELAASSNLDNLSDDQKDIGLQLYNASGMQSEWGDMVVDGKNAVTDKPIDDVPAEEINDEEITENDEGSRTKPKTPESDSDIEEDTQENEGGRRSVEEVINIEEPTKHETTEENQKEDEIAATANRLVERILQEEENEQATAANDEIPEDVNIQEASDIENKVESTAQSRQQSVASSQEDINSEDEVQSSEEEERSDDDDEIDDDENDDDENDDDENDDDESDEEEEKNANDNNESKDIKNGTTQPQSEKEESEVEEPATKENRTNKKVEQERSDPAAAKKNQIKQDHDKGRRRGKRVDTKA